MSTKWFRIVALLAAWIGISSGGAPAAAAGPAPTVGKAAPAFTLVDVGGTPRALAAQRGRPVALFFFCGCQPCWQVATEWAKLQRGGALPPASKPAQAPVTLVVYSLSAGAARTMGKDSGLDEQTTHLLPDPQESVTRGLYRADPCPRVFVLDGKGVVRYTNGHQGDAPQKAPALAIVSRALDALRAVSAHKPAPSLPADR